MIDPLCNRNTHPTDHRWLVALVIIASVSVSHGGELDFAHGLYRQEKFQLAAEEYEQYLNRNPVGPDEDQARFYLGESLLQLQRWKEARPSFERIWEKSRSAGATVPPEYAAQSLFRLGQVAGQLQDHASAIEHLKQFRSQYPDHPRRDQAEQLLSESAISTEDWDLARSSMDEAKRLSPTGPIRDRVDLLEVRLLDKRGELDQAAAGYEGLVARWSGDPAKRSLVLDALYARGLVAIRQKQDAKGAEVFARGRQLAEGLPIEESMALQEAAARLTLGELEAASAIVDQVKRITRVAETRAHALYLTARLGARQGNVDQAMQAVSEIEKLEGAEPWLPAAQIAMAEAWLADSSRPPSERAARTEELAGAAGDSTARERIIYLASVAYLDAKQFDDAARLSLPQVQAASSKRKPAFEYVLGMARYHQGDWGESARLLADAADLLDEESAGTAWLTAGQALLKDPSSMTQGEKWKRVIKQIAKRADGGKYLRRLGDEAYREKKFQRAEEVFRQAVDHPQADQPGAWLGLGWTLFDLAKLDESLTVFRLAVEKGKASSPELAEGLYMVATIEQQQGKDESAKMGYARVFHDFVDSPFAIPAGQRWAKMLASEKSPDAEQALEELMDRAEAGPVAASAIVDRAWLALDRGDEASARTWLVRALDVSQGGASAVRGAIKLAELSQKDGKSLEAKGYLDRAQAIGVPEALEAAYRYRLGLVLRDMGEKGQAFEALQQVVERFSSTDFAKASLFALGELSFDDKPADGIRFYRLLADRADAGSYGAVARLRLAQSHLKMGEWKEAAMVAEQLMNDSVEKPTREEAVYVLARVHQQKAEFDRARELYGTIIGTERTETAAKAQFMIAETLFLQERWNEAIKEFLKVSILYPIPEWQSLALLEVGKCHARQSQSGEAKKAFDEVIAKYASLPAAQEAKKQLELLDKP